MRPSREERRAYRSAESRIRESILLRDVLPEHSYPERSEDLEVMRRYHAEHGTPPVGFFGRWLRRWRIRGGGVSY